MPGDVATILVLDDDEGIVTLQRRALTRAGFDVLATTDVEEARAHVRGGRVELMVLDYQLQNRLTGLELHAALKAEGFDVPAVLVTGFSDERKAIEALRAGFRDVIPKLEGYLDHLPLSAERVIKQVRAERQLAESEAVRQSEERLRLALEAGRMATWDWDLRTDDMVWSTLHYELLGYAPAGVPSTYRMWAARVHPDDLAAARVAIEKCVALECDYACVYRVVWPDGTVRWLDARGRCRLDPMGRPVRMHGVTADITDRKAVEQELVRARARAEDASRAKDQFLAVLSHELRTPLTPVLAGVQLLEEEPGLPADAIEHVRLIRRNVELEARLIDDLLDLTRIVRGKVELQCRTIDAHEAIRHVLAACAADFEDNTITLRSDLAAARSHVDADPARLQQVLWNLMKNAAKFTPAGGRVSVRTDNDAAARLRLVVEDNGVGIDAAVLPMLFEPFEQGGREITRRFGGLGLGLSISRGLVERHGGTLTAGSDGAGRGAAFTLTLPTVDAAAASGESAGPAPAAAGVAPLRILLVEDHDDTRHLMARLLGQSGYAVTTADSVAAAVAQAHSPFDLLISDLGLPDGSGLDVIRELAKIRPVRGIVMSGFGMEADVNRSREAGFAEHLTKPVAADRLRAAITRLTQDPSAGFAPKN